MSDIEKQLEYTLSADRQAIKTKVPRKENINLIHNALSGTGETYDIIMKKTGLTRPTVTKYLEKLGQMGIVRSEGKKPKLFYPIKDEVVGASSGDLIQPHTIEVGQKPDKIERDVLDYEVLQEMGNYALIYSRGDDKHIFGNISILDRDTEARLDVFKIKRNKHNELERIALIDGKIYCLTLVSSLFNEQPGTSDEKIKEMLIPYLKDSTPYALDILKNERLIKRENGKRFITEECRELLNSIMSIVYEHNGRIEAGGKLYRVVNNASFLALHNKYPLKQKSNVVLKPYELDKKVSGVKIELKEEKDINGIRKYLLRVDGSTKPKKRELVVGNVPTEYGKELLEFDDGGMDVGRVPKTQVESMSFFDLVQVVTGKVILTPTGFEAKKSVKMASDFSLK